MGVGDKIFSYTDLLRDKTDVTILFKYQKVEVHLHQIFCNQRKHFYFSARNLLHQEDHIQDGTRFQVENLPWRILLKDATGYVSYELTAIHGTRNVPCLLFVSDDARRSQLRLKMFHTNNAS